MQPESSCRTVRIFVSSPGDVRSERNIASRVLQYLQAEFSTRLFIDPFFWENERKFTDHDYQSNIEPPSHFDLFLCFLWSRIGTRLHPDKYKRPDGSCYQSGTEYEFEDAMAAYRKSGSTPRIMLFRKNVLPVIPVEPAQEREERTAQYEALKAFLETWTKDPEYKDVYSAAVNTYTTVQQFEESLTKHLRQYFESLLPPHLIQRDAATWKHGSPFMGLHYFDFEHAPIFQGRTQAVQTAFKQLTDQFKEKSPFLLIGGDSGVGKSSLARAGLLPLLLRPYQELHTAAWRYAALRPADVRPGETDFCDTLARALTQRRSESPGILLGPQTLCTLPLALPELLDGLTDVASLAHDLRTTPLEVTGRVQQCLLGLSKAIHGTDDLKNKPLVRLCLLLDQLEELFTTPSATPENRASFFSALRRLVESKLVFVVGTMRADCLGYCAEIEDLMTLKAEKGYFHLGPPSKDDIARIIRLPAQAAGLTFEINAQGDRLDDRIRDDVVRCKGAAALPLLEFTLEQLYEKAQEADTAEQRTLLTFAHYERMGGLEGAIASKAQEALDTYSQHRSDASTVFSRVMRRLIGRVQEGGYTRKVALRQNLDSIDGGKELVDAFIAARLFVAGKQDEGDAPTVCIVHEALLEHWDALVQWINVECEYFVLLQRLENAHAQWQEECAKERGTKSVRQTEVLLHEGKPLRDAEYLLKHHGDELTTSQKHFIALSQKYAERKKRRLQVLAAVLLVLLALTLWMWNQAVQAEREAEMTRQNAEELSAFMIYDLSDKLEPLGKLDLMDSVNQKVDAYYKKRGDNLDADSLHRKTALLISQGNTLKAQGRTGDALIKYKEGLHIFRMQWKDNPENTWLQRNVSIVLNKVGGILQAQGKTQEALGAYQESLNIAHNLVEQSPANAVWQRDVSVSLNNVGDILKTQGKEQEALQAYQEALNIAHTLSRQDPGNTQWQRDISVSLNNVGDILKTQGKTQEALQAFQESLNIRRSLTMQDPGNTQLQRDVSVSLDKMGNILNTQGKTQEALQAYQESLDIARILASQDSGNAEWQRDVSISLDKMGNILNTQGKTQEALQAFQESLHIARTLASQDPGNTQWQRDVSISLNNVGDILKTQGKLQEALLAYQEDLSIARTLASQDPGNTQWQRDVSISLNKIGDILKTQGKLQEALLAYQESLNIARDLTKQDPGNTQWQRDVSISLNKIGDILKKTQGKLQEALLAYQESLNIARDLTKQDPGNTQWQRDVSISLDNVGDILKIQGKLQEALLAYQESLNIARDLAKQNPGNTQWQRDVSISLNNVGDILKTQGKLQEALLAYQEGLTLRRTLVSQDPGNTQWQRDVSTSLNNVGDILKTQGKFHEALQVYQECLTLRRTLAKQNPVNTQWQRDVSISLNNVGDILKTQGKFHEALQVYQECLTLRRTLASQNSGNTQWQRDISISLDNVGDILKIQGKLQEALLVYQESLNIARDLAKQNPGNTQWQRDVSISLNNVGDILKTQGKLQEALLAYQEGLTVRRTLVSQNPGNTEWQRDVMVSLYKIHISLKQQDPQQARSRLNEAIAITRQLVKRDASNAQWQKDLRVLLKERAALETPSAPQTKKR